MTMGCCASAEAAAAAPHKPPTTYTFMTWAAAAAPSYRRADGDTGSDGHIKVAANATAYTKAVNSAAARCCWVRDEVQAETMAAAADTAAAQRMWGR